MDAVMQMKIITDPESELYDIAYVLDLWRKEGVCSVPERLRLIDSLKRTRPTWEFWRYAEDSETGEKHTWVISAGFAIIAWDNDDALVVGQGRWLWDCHNIDINILKRAKSEEQMRKRIVYAVGERMMCRGNVYFTNPPPVGFTWGIDVGGGPGYTPNAKRQSHG